MRGADDCEIWYSCILYFIYVALKSFHVITQLGVVMSLVV